MKTSMNELNTKELDLNELEQANGGWWFVIIGAVATGYCIYEGIKKGIESDWK